jgi:hypothetical protein
VRCPRWKCRLGIMQSRLGTVALNCLKIGGAGTLLSAPLGFVSLAAGEAAYAGGIATMLVAGAVATVADRQEMARLTSAARRVATRVHVHIASRRDAATAATVYGGSVVIVHDGAQISG